MLTLVKNGFASGCLSNDNDLLVYGCPMTFQNFIFKGEQVTEYNLKHILETFNITYLQFVDMCIMLGTDYNKPIYGIKPEIALECIKTYYNLENILAKMGEINNIIMPKYREKYPKLRKLRVPDPSLFDYSKVRSIFTEPLDISTFTKESNTKILTATYLCSSKRISELEQFLIETVKLEPVEASYKVRYIVQVWQRCTLNNNTKEYRKRMIEHSNTRSSFL